MLSAARLDPSRFVQVSSAHPAGLYGLYPRKGALLPGLSDADLVVWYPSGGLEPFEIWNEGLHHGVDYTPYEGRVVTQWPRYTVLRGRVVYDRDGGGLVGEKSYGRFLERGVSTLAGSLKGGGWDVEAF